MTSMTDSKYTEITVSAKHYVGYDDSLEAARLTYLEEHESVDDWQVEARWADDERDEIVLTVPRN